MASEYFTVDNRGRMSVTQSLLRDTLARSIYTVSGMNLPTSCCIYCVMNIPYTTGCIICVVYWPSIMFNVYSRPEPN